MRIFFAFQQTPIPEISFNSCGTNAFSRQQSIGRHKWHSPCLKEQMGSETKQNLTGIGSVIMNQRMCCPKLEGRIMSAQQAAELIQDGMVVATSGFTLFGHPKIVPQAL